ncbi:MAG: aminotransferase class I/II-fold pyridoxal phosphate-dependent enzyme [Rhodothermales bacterium]|nr:aminotransferase class I/II-fold pyridoxal phosphate-dependent enzyme [Rhodothermales bacterium]
MRSITDNLLRYSDTVESLLRALNRGIFGVVFVVDDEGVMVGLFTDGDVRRALLAGATLDEPIERYMNRTFAAGSAGAARADNLKLLNERVRHLPLLNERGQPVDLISWAEMWRLPVTQPALGGNELKYVSDCIATNWISSQGEYVNRFQETFRAYVGSEHALCTSSGTTALHLALVALGVGPGDEVIVPNLTFGASANAVIHAGAIPVFADVDPDTWTLSAAGVREALSVRTRAIMPVHLYGHPCDMDPIMDLARRHNLFVVEDCAEALGAEYKGRQVGTFGDVGCFSFFANKVITTGEGGMVTTNRRSLHEKMAILRDHGMEKSRRYWHLYAGFNYRMTNIQAAIGLAQMERVDAFLAKRLEIVDRYNRGLGDLPGIILPPEAPWARNIFWLYSILIDESVLGLDRDTLRSVLAEHGIETRNFFCPLHDQPAYIPYAHGDFPVTASLAARGMNLPTSNDLSLEDVDRVCTIIRQSVRDAHLIRSRFTKTLAALPA